MSRLTAENLRQIEARSAIKVDSDGNRYVEGLGSLLRLLRVKGDVEVPDYMKAHVKANGKISLDIDARLLAEMSEALGSHIRNLCNQRRRWLKVNKFTQCTEECYDADLIKVSVDKAIEDSFRSHKR